MYTQCPECLTIFEIDEESLQASLGIVHCGHCSTRFDALRSLSNTLPLDPEAPLVETDAEPKVLTLTSAVSPAELELAARKNRGAEQSAAPTASPATPAETPTETQPGNPSAANVNADWLANLHTDLTDALIADAAGIPRDGTRDHNTWRLLDAPVQTRFSELDIIPVTSAELAAIESERNELPAGQTEPAPEDAGITSDREPTITSSQMEILAAETDAAGPAQVATEQAASELIGFDSPSLDTSGDITPAEIDDIDFATVDVIDPAATEIDVDEFAAMEATTEPAPDATEAQAPIYIRPRQRRFSRASALWTLGCLVLAVILAGQLAWAKRAALLQNPQTRAWVTRACDAIPCHLPPIRDLAKLELLSRDIRPDPRTSGALVITATLRNNANFRQPWPVVTVELSDLDGKPVAMRRFRSAEYIPGAVRRAAGIAAGATAAVAFEVADPGKNAVNFQFSFE